MPRTSISRRKMLGVSALGGFAAVVGLPAFVRGRSLQDKLNIAVVGCGNRGAQNIAGITGRNIQNLGGLGQENLVALCDVDERQAVSTYRRFPTVPKFQDYRKMLDAMDKEIDAVLVATPDHVHAPASVLAMRRGKHCYCEKPLSHSVYEARVMAQVAAESKVATQMGNQIHAGDNYRRVVELIRGGAIGAVRECYVWVATGDPSRGVYSGKGVTRSADPDAILDRPKETPPVPAELNWDLWLGPAPERPYHPCYVPHDWHYWWDFSGGTLSNFGCHYMDLPFWALELRSPSTVEAEGSPLRPEATPHSLTVRYEFPARGDWPPVKLIWGNGPQSCRPDALDATLLAQWPNGILFVGEKGMLLADYGKRKLLPESQFADFQPPAPTIPASIGHHEEWLAACKTGSPTTCCFDYGGALTETVLLGNVAFRSKAKIEWDAKKLKIPNAPAAEQFLRRDYRQGWVLG